MEDDANTLFDRIMLKKEEGNDSGKDLSIWKIPSLTAIDRGRCWRPTWLTFIHVLSVLSTAGHFYVFTSHKKILNLAPNINGC